MHSRSCFTIRHNHTTCAWQPSFARLMDPCLTTVWAKWIVGKIFLHLPLEIFDCVRKAKGSVATLTLYIVKIDSTRQEVIRKTIDFIWNDNNAKEISPTYLLEVSTFGTLFWQSMGITELFCSRRIFSFYELRDWDYSIWRYELVHLGKLWPEFVFIKG